MEKRVAIIIPCRNEGLNLRHTLDFMLRTEARDLARIIVINDGSTDNGVDFLRNGRREYQGIEVVDTPGLGAAAARNLGADMCAGQDAYVFCDGHIIMQKGWLTSLLASLEHPHVDAVVPGIGPFDPSLRAGYGQTWDERLEIKWLDAPHDLAPTPLAPGACLCIKRYAFEDVGGFDRGFRSWGYEDVEISIKLWLFGYRIYVDPRVRIGHRFRKVPPYQVDTAEFLYNRLRLAVSHFKEERIARVVELLPRIPAASQALARALASDCAEQRKQYVARRKYDDNWFFSTFAINF